MDTERFQAEGSTVIGRSRQAVFAFLCDPGVDPAALTPMEDEVVAWQETKGVGSVTRTTIELAARELEVTSTCVEFEPPQQLGLRLEGDLQGTQRWRLEEADSGTRLYLALDIARPEWTPQYLKQEQVAQNWGRMLVDQTLENVKAALEGRSALR